MNYGYILKKKNFGVKILGLIKYLNKARTELLVDELTKYLPTKIHIRHWNWIRLYNYQPLSGLTNPSKRNDIQKAILIAKRMPHIN